MLLFIIVLSSESQTHRCRTAGAAVPVRYDSFEKIASFREHSDCTTEKTVNGKSDPTVQVNADIGNPGKDIPQTDVMLTVE